MLAGPLSVWQATKTFVSPLLIVSVYHACNEDRLKKFASAAGVKNGHFACERGNRVTLYIQDLLTVLASTLTRLQRRKREGLKMEGSNTRDSRLGHLKRQVCLFSIATASRLGKVIA
jgi:hypothetical protein